MNNVFPSSALCQQIRSQTGIWGSAFCALFQTVHTAAQAILQAKNDGLDTIEKQDGSPVTNADKQAQDIILKDIGNLSQILPKAEIVSEESPPLPPANLTQDFWLIDPLDGTKGFVKGQAEFCINIALLQKGVVTFSIVGVPASGLIYFAARGKGAWKIETDTGHLEQIHCRKLTQDILKDEGLRILASTRLHSQSLLDTHLQTQRGNPKIAFLKKIGSAVKILQIAEGKADYYYQPGPTMAWDIAAPQLILEEAGGAVRTLDGNPLSYGRNGWKNGVFEVLGTSEHLFS